MLPTTSVRALDEDGFTLIELLVVILIIGVLAAIAIPSFLSQRGRAYDADAKTVVRTGQMAEDVFYTGGQLYASQPVGAGPGAPLNTIEPTLTGPSAACVGTPPFAQGVCGLTATAVASGYQVSVTSQTGVAFTLTQTSTGAIQRTCDVSGAAGGAGGCHGVVSGVGSW